MPSPTLVESEPQRDAAGDSGKAKGTHPAVLATGSALLLWASFPPADWGWLAWVALVPLFLLASRKGSGWSLYLGAWVGGMAFWTLAIQWVRLSDPSAWLGWLTMAFALSLFWPAFLVLARLGALRLGLPLMIAAPVAWVALEYLRAHILSGFPWYYLAHSQHAVLPLIQVADVTGSLGLSLLVATVNAWVVGLLTQPLLRSTARGTRLTARQSLRLGVVGLSLALTLGYGVVRLAGARFRPGPRVLLLQSNLPQRFKMGGDPNALVEVYRRLIERGLAASGKDPIDLIVWPETSYPFSFSTIDSRLDDRVLAQQLKNFGLSFRPVDWRTRTERLTTHLLGWADQARVPMLVGTITYEHRLDGQAKYNSAILFSPGKTSLQSYHKLHLVPFGEYVPLIKLLPFLTVLTPYHGDEVPTLAFGPSPRWLDVGPHRYASAICFEDTVPHVVSRFFAEAPDRRPPDVLVNMSNDGWFGASSEHEMHLVASVFRAVENRVPLARSANTGISAIIDGDGRILQSLATATEGVLTGVVPLDDRQGLYSFWGDWVGQSCLAVSIGLVVLARFRPGRRIRPAITP